ncbi:MAG: lipid A export permease/ATP-binding protein MsbA [Pseudomonadota bacterium]
MLNQSTFSGLAVYSRLLGYVKPYKLAFVVAILGNIAYGVLDALTIQFIQPLLDKGFMAHNSDFIRWLPATVILLFTARSAATFVSSYFMGWVARRVVMDMRQQVFRHLVRLPHMFYDQHTSGELISCITYNVEQVANASTDALTVLVRETFATLGLLGVMFYQSWQLTLLFLVMLPAMVYIMQRVSIMTRAVSSHIQESIADVTHLAEEAIVGQSIIKAYATESIEAARFEDMTQKNRHQEMRFIRISAISIPMLQICIAIALSITLYLATANTMFSATITPGGFTAIVGAMLLILKPIKQLAKVNSTIQRGISAAASVFWTLDQQPEENNGAHTAPRLRGQIDYDHLSFHYNSAEKRRDVLTDIDIHIQPGERVALVGASGGGKTTLVNLLLRFYLPQKGEIRIDGVPLSDWDLRTLRQQIAVVSQNVMLFNDTLARNIAYGMPHLSLVDIEEAARQAHLSSFIEGLPEGYQTLVGENGTRLSGGQRQRVAIARAILKNAPILILDEATSALDTESERKIQQAFETLMKGRTTLVIAHRLSTIEQCDRILVLEAGAVVESGTHQELLARGTRYAQLWAAQFQDA